MLITIISSLQKRDFMIFLDPTSDIAFKKIFGSTAHKNILIDFLNAVLERAPGEKNSRSYF